MEIRQPNRYGPRGRFSKDDEDLADTVREVARGDVAEALMASEGWKLVLDWFEGEANAALRRLRQEKSGNEKVVAELCRRWQVTEELLERLQQEMIGAIEHRQAILDGMTEVAGEGEPE